MMFASYIVYLTASILLTVWLGSALHREGRMFLLDCFAQVASTADAVNHLLLVGFYLVNISWIGLTLKTSESPDTAIEAIHFLSYRLGIVSLLLGGMHFMNLVLFTQVKARRLREPSLLIRSSEGR